MYLFLYIILCHLRCRLFFTVKFISKTRTPCSLSASADRFVVFALKNKCLLRSRLFFLPFVHSKTRTPCSLSANADRFVVFALKNKCLLRSRLFFLPFVHSKTRTPCSLSANADRFVVFALKNKCLLRSRLFFLPRILYYILSGAVKPNISIDISSAFFVIIRSLMKPACFSLSSSPIILLSW